MSYLVYKQPLNLDSLGKSQNEIYLEPQMDYNGGQQIAEEDLEEYIGADAREKENQVDLTHMGVEPNDVHSQSLMANTVELSNLNLVNGVNEVVFTVNGADITGKLFYWDYNAKIVISDIDGTITRSDVGGHVLPRFGKDWSHDSVCELYQKISAAGY